MLFSIVFMRETYATTLLGRKAARLRRETGNPQLRSKLDSGLSPKALFLLSIVRPTKMLLFSPICLALSILMAVVYGYLYLLFTTFPVVYEGQYGFTSGTVGLTYVGLGIGNLIGLGIFGVVSDKILKKMSAQGEMKPEYRLPPMVFGAPFIPIGLFWYGWAAEAKTHWIVPILGTLFFGIGLLATFVSFFLALLISSLTRQDEHYDVSGRCVYHLRCICPGCQHGASVHLWGGAAAGRAENVPNVGTRMGEFVAGFHCIGHVSCSVDLLQVWREDQEEQAAEALSTCRFVESA